MINFYQERTNINNGGALTPGNHNKEASSIVGAQLGNQTDPFLFELCIFFSCNGTNVLIIKPHLFSV